MRWRGPARVDEEIERDVAPVHGRQDHADHDHPDHAEHQHLVGAGQHHAEYVAADRIGDVERHHAEEEQAEQHAYRRRDGVGEVRPCDLGHGQLGSRERSRAPRGRSAPSPACGGGVGRGHARTVPTQSVFTAHRTCRDQDYPGIRHSNPHPNPPPQAGEGAHRPRPRPPRPLTQPPACSASRRSRPGTPAVRRSGPATSRATAAPDARSGNRGSA